MENKIPSIRLFVNDSLAAGLRISAGEKQAHYLLHVMRCHDGDEVALFNGADGEWLASVSRIGKRDVSFDIIRKLRQQADVPDCWLCFAPIKAAPVEYLAQKATELGVSRLQPVFTRQTAVARINIERLKANAIEAAEQSERLSVPEVVEAVTLPELIAHWESDRTLIFCDESGAGQPLAKMLSKQRADKFAILIGPEGGFTEQERELIRSLPQAIAVGLGPRIMKADTAAIAAIACVQSVWGDWGE